MSERASSADTVQTPLPHSRTPSLSMSKHLTKEEISVNEHMEDLRERMRVLRKGYSLTHPLIASLI